MIPEKHYEYVHFERSLMNPNRISRELRGLPGNIRSPRLPGGTLISAVLDRKLMTWSDRGGASRIFGDVWSEHCWAYLSNGADLFNGAGFDHSNGLIIRLDDNPKIAIQAGRQKLPNPDFLIVHPESDDRYSVRAVDAKFAVDRLRRIQVSPESIRQLIELPNSLARQELEQRAGADVFERLSYESGLFLGPRSLLNGYFYEQSTGGEDPSIPVDELILLPVRSGDLFDQIDEYPLMQFMQSIDELHADSPEVELVLGMYYLRLASAARWIETQVRTPLLSDEPPESVDVDDVLAIARQRRDADVSAYGLIEAWSVAAEESIQRQNQVNDAARLPIRMSELRRRIEQYGFGEDKKILRKTRGILEHEFMRRLIDETGSIPANPAGPIGGVIQQVSETSRGLRSGMLQEIDRVIQQVVEQESTSA